MADQVESKSPTPLVVMGTLAAIVVILIGMREFASILGPFFLVISLFIAAYPIQPKLVSLGVPRALASTALGLVVFAILGAFFYALGWALTSLIQTLPGYQDEFWSLYTATVEWLSTLGVSEAEVLQVMQGINPASFASVLQSLLRELTDIVTVLAVLITMVFMMAIDSGTFALRNHVLNRHQPRVWLSVVDYTLGVRRYWVVTTLFGLLVAVIDTFALMALQVPLALVWGILSFLTNYIPNIGFLIGVVPPTLMALLANDPLTALLVIGVYAVVNFVIQAVIQPKFNGDAVGVTATVALLSLMLWGGILGALGALLALPMTLLAKALFIDHDPNMRWLNTFISNEPETGNPGVVASVTGPTPTGEPDQSLAEAVELVTAENAPTEAAPTEESEAELAEAHDTTTPGDPCPDPGADGSTDQRL
ncbi:MAG: AI-2E family transporter [Propioniciclava sp.]